MRDAIVDASNLAIGVIEAAKRRKSSLGGVR
jgi:hypothetical protein